MLHESFNFNVIKVSALSTSKSKISKRSTLSTCRFYWSYIWQSKANINRKVIIVYCEESSYVVKFIFMIIFRGRLLRPWEWQQWRENRIQSGDRWGKVCPVWLLIGLLQQAAEWGSSGSAFRIGCQSFAKPCVFQSKN